MKKIIKISFALLISFAAISCSPSYNSIKRMQRIEEGVSNPTTKEELEEAIKKYDARAMDLALTEGQIGIWYKILGTRYIDQQMYGKALECFQKALTYYNDKEILGNVCIGLSSYTSICKDKNILVNGADKSRFSW